MSKSKRKTAGQPTKETAKRSLKSEVWGLALVTIGICLFLALISFSRVDVNRQDEVVNLIGPVGVQIADWSLSTFGLCAFFLNAVLLFFGFALLFGRHFKPNWMEVGGSLIALPTGAVCLHLIFGSKRILSHKAGGYIGELGAEIGRSLLGSVGTAIFTGAMLVLAMTLIAESNPSSLVIRLGIWLFSIFGKLTASIKKGFLGVANQFSRSWASWREKRPKPQPESLELLVEDDDIVFSFSEEPECNEPTFDEPARPQPVINATYAGPKVYDLSAVEPEPEKQPKNGRQKQAEDNDMSSKLQLCLERTPLTGSFQLPPTTLLSNPPPHGNKIDHNKLKAAAVLIENALREFKVEGKVTGITPGPVVTMFEYEPAPGVKINSILNLSADLARIIKAKSVRIVPIPGKGVVGLEVPNESRVTVYLREIIEDSTFQNHRAKLPLALGMDISGKPVVTDLAKMPHLLVAGTTGSGKSVAINTMVTSLLYRATPDEVRMIMVDPKMLELSIYDGIPHLLVPVVTDPKKAATALRWAVDEMERRYALMASARVRNISGFNKELEQLSKTAPEDLPRWVERDAEGQPRLEKLPYLVIIIDEFADLMMVASKDVELCVARLAQKARAAGVHLIVATQRPSVDVITGLIKANFPTRISFQVGSRVDSRTVLDTQGAEALLGLGDMLFRPPGRSDLVRAHGAFIDEKEIIQIVEMLKAQGEPDYRDDVLSSADSDSEGDEEELADEMYDMAVELVTRERKASISWVQRKLRVGYNRAARIIEMMEREGIVGPSDGRGGREVIAPPPPPI